MKKQPDKLSAVEDQLRNLKAELPEPHLNLSDEHKQGIIAKVGLSTVKSILKAKKDFSVKRIPFLFSSVDTQIVVDILANDWKKF